MEDEARHLLNGVGETVRGAVLLERHVEFGHAADGIVRERHVAVFVFVDERPEEILGIDVVPAVVVVKADDLRMGMALGAARAGAEVAEIDDRFEFFPERGLPPFLQSEGDHFVELVRRVGGNVPAVLGGLHEDRGPRVVKDGVFIHEPDHVAAALEYVGERLRMAEGARRALRRVGFFFSDV